MELSFCGYARELIVLERKRPLDMEDNTRLCRLILSGLGHMFDKEYVCYNCCINFAQRAWALHPDVCVLWERTSIFPYKTHIIRDLLSTEYMWKDLDKVEVRVLASPTVDDEVKEAVRAELAQRRWAGGCRRAWIAAVACAS